jgi:ATP-dependent helicase/nuclease subunit A
MLVEAAAGTGKTTSLVGRMVALLREGKCAMESLAAVTFTRKAAAELRLRFQVELERAARDAGAGADRLATAVGQLERCFIGTIHSFCARLLRERPVEAGVDLAFEELDPDVDDLLRRQAWDEFVAGLFAREDPLLDELGRVGLEIGTLGSIFLQFANFPDVDEWPATPVALPDLRPATTALREYGAHMQQLAEAFPDDRGNDQLMNQYERIVLMLRQADLRQPPELMEILEQFRDVKLVLKNWPGGAAQAKADGARWNTFRVETAEPLVRCWRELRYPIVIRALQSATAVYAGLRHQAGGLNYQDLLLKAAVLLRDKPKVRAYFRRRFTHLLVDEFQDTDPIQAQVMLLLTSDNLKEKDWRKCRPVPGSLFVVGDPKQSIYRFRRADIVTYDRVRGIIGECGEVLSLQANFRAVRPLIDWINRSFDEVFPEVANAHSPKNAPLLPGRGGAEDCNRLEVQVLQVPQEHATNKPALEYEANLVARYIRHALDFGLAVPRSPQALERGAPPGVTAADFMIITRNKKNLTLFAQQLEQLGIPCQVTGGSALQDIPELVLLHGCLGALAQPENAVALVAVLRSELFGISDAALYTFKRSGGHFSFHREVPADLPTDTQEVFEDAFARLRKYEGWLKHLPLPAALDRMVDDLGLSARAAAGPGGNVQSGTLAKALQLLRSATLDLHCPEDLLDYLGELLVQTKEFEGAAALPWGESAVRIMNLHKAKGLEAAVVFLADATGFSTHEPTVYIDRSKERVCGYLAISETRSAHHPRRLAQPPKWEEWVQEERRFQDAENERLLYVAATRTGAQLIITQRCKGNSSNPWSFFERHLGQQAALLDPGPQTAAQAETVSVSADDIASATAAIRKGWQTVLRPSYRVQRVKAAAISAQTPPPASVGEYGTEWGTVLHQLHETAMREPDANLVDLAYLSLAEQPGLAERGVSLAQAEEAVRTVQAVTRSGIWCRALASSERYVEIPFQSLVAGEAGDGTPTLLRGTIDLAFREKNGWVVVDYKTDARPAERLAELVRHYSGQVKRYAEVWHAMVGEPIQEAGLYFTCADRYVPVSGR